MRTLVQRKASLAAVAVLTLASAPAGAQELAKKRVLVIAQLAAGTGLDILARTYAEQLSQRIGQPVVVENRPGSAGLAAAEGVQKSEPDGTTLGVMTSSVMAIRPTMFKKAPYDPIKDFVPIALYTKSPFVMVVNPKLPVHSVSELIAYIRANKGKLSYASPSVGGAPHLAVELLKQLYDLDITHVPYRNGPQAIADVAAGHIAMTVAEVGGVRGLVREGNLRALGVTSNVRLPTVPEVPTIGSSIQRPDFEAVSWHVLVAPAATPRPIVERLHAEMKRIMGNKDLQARFATYGLLPLDPPSIDDARRYIASEIVKWGTLVRSLGMAGTI